MRGIPRVPLYLEDHPELEQLLHPAAAFNHPRDVVNDPDLSNEEKRAILSSWASDACVVESQPRLRRQAGSMRAVTFDDVIDALRSLDFGPPPKWKRVLRKQQLKGSGEHGGGLRTS